MFNQAKHTGTEKTLCLESGICVHRKWQRCAVLLVNEILYVK